MNMQHTVPRCHTPARRDAWRVLSRQGGQAAIEFVAGLLLLLLVLTGIIHTARLARTSLFLHGELRAEAGESAMANTLASTPRLIGDWDAGADNVRYTADDTSRSSMGYMNVISLVTRYSVASPDDWRGVESKTQLPESMVNLEQNGFVSALLGCTHREESIRVPVDPVIRQLVYDKDYVTIKEEVWMPMMGGLY